MFIQAFLDRLLRQIKAKACAPLWLLIQFLAAGIARDSTGAGALGRAVLQSFCNRDAGK